MVYTSRSLEETRRVAEAFINTIVSDGSSGTVVALNGDLGSGKTAFVQAVGEILDIKENMHSPTFVIMKIYQIQNSKLKFRNLVHIDAYRLEREEELLHLGWEEIISEPENLIFIEWPENVPGIIPESARKIFFKFVDENTREISYEN